MEILAAPGAARNPGGGRIAAVAVSAHNRAMRSRNRLFEDAARVAEGALGGAVGLRREVEAMARARFERMLAGMDLVKREEFEAVREMAANARAEQERLADRLAALERASRTGRVGED